jgi:predicted peptidase
MPPLKRAALPLLTLACLALAQARGGEATKTGFIDKVYKGPDGAESKYVVFVPHDYKGGKDYPCILFLHGAGETGTDGQKQTKVGLGPAVKKQEKTFPFIVVFPQSHKKSWKADSDDGKTALAILAEVQRAYKVDAKRIYLTGLSMGGSGTWSQAAAHPEMWAAVAPLCGRCDPATVTKIKDLPIWCFCGDQDKEDLVKNNREVTKALKDAGAAVRYEEYKGVGHNCWDRAYATQELFDWMLKHKAK